MQRITKPMFRYGDPDWDRDYLNWGFHNEETQLEEAESILHLIDRRAPLRLLDVACGIGRHAVHWASRGHSVTAIDISQTFVDEGRKLAKDRGVKVDFLVGDVRDLHRTDAFDAVIWIEKAFCDPQALAAIYDSLSDGGVFIQDIRNRNHPRTRAVTGDWERWREEGGLFKLERHWNTEDGVHHDVWIDVDPAAGRVIEKTNECKAGSWEDHIQMLHDAGFRDLEDRTMQGELFKGGEEPCWLWQIAKKR